MKHLIFITSQYPYTINSETFIENEINYLSCAFDKISIFPVRYRPDATLPRSTPNNCEVFALKDISKKEVFSRYAIKVLFDKHFWDEIYFVLLKKKNKWECIKLAYRWFAFSNYYVDGVYELLKNFSKDSFFIYSYWGAMEAITAVFLRDKIKCNSYITRIHGYDIYEYRSKINYLPFRKLIYTSADYICPCSEDGVRYLFKKYDFSDKLKNKVYCSHIGTENDLGVNLKGNLKKNTFQNFLSFKLYSS